MPDFLLELRSEEIPARMQEGARDDLARLFAAELAAAGLVAQTIQTFATPRRLALIARGLPAETAAASEEIKGPRANAPPQALEGFLRKTGLTREELTERDGILFAVTEKPGRPTGALLADAIPAIVRAFPWPKSMRWGAASVSTESPRWVRPLQGIVALFGEEIVPVEIAGVGAEPLDDARPLRSGAATLGHRFHHPGVITIGCADDYEAKLRACHVILDGAERRRIIAQRARAAASAAGLVLVEDEGLLAENAGLTEWPVPLLGRFDPGFLEVPREVIMLTMRTNQKYFSCTDGDGALAPAFVCTANIEACDGGTAIVRGNERVLSARLADAKFFWEQDLKVPLEEQAKKLGGIVFHEKLGTLADKVERVAKLARWLIEEGIVQPSPRVRGEGKPRSGEGEGDSASIPTLSIPPLPGAARASPVPLPASGEREALAALAERAARLCKADLVTGLVGEFPELQGIVGGHLALAQGEDPRVADAIRDHYKPVGQGDEVPTAPVTVAVSLADKLDTLCGFYGRELRPTGSKDPFALRRAMLGVISIFARNGLRRSFHDLTMAGTHGYLAVWGSVHRDLLDFAIDRLKVQQREAGVRHDLIDAVFALGGEDDLVRLLARVRALQAFVETGEGADLLAAYKRAANILKKEGWDAGGCEGSVRPERSRGALAPDERPSTAIGANGAGESKKTLSYTPDPVESLLVSALDSAEPRARAAVEAEDFEGAMAALASLRGPIDAFFDKVTVNDPERAKRSARLDLLGRFRAAVHQVADFSKIEG